MSKTIPAIGFYECLPISHPDSLIDVQIQKPVATCREIIVNVKSIAVNPADVFLRSTPLESLIDTFPVFAIPTPGSVRIQGWDVSGVVDSVGHECSLFKPGDEVYYSGNAMGAGSNSEFAAIDERLVGKKPRSINHSDSAAFPLVSITVWEAMFDLLKLDIDGKDKDKSILIIGGAGGTGSMAIQLAQQLCQMNVITTAGNERSAQWCKAMGAKHVLDYKKDMKEQLKSLDLEYVDYILCTNNTAHYFDIMVDLIKPFGHICTIVANKDVIDTKQLRLKSAAYSVSFMGLRPNGYEIERHGQILNTLSSLIDSGIIKIITTNYMPLINAENLKSAHKLIESGTTIGKVTLSNWDHN